MNEWFFVGFVSGLLAGIFGLIALVWRVALSAFRERRQNMLDHARALAELAGKPRPQSETGATN